MLYAPPSPPPHPHTTPVVYTTVLFLMLIIFGVILALLYATAHFAFCALIFVVMLALRSSSSIAVHFAFCFLYASIVLMLEPHQEIRTKFRASKTGLSTHPSPFTPPPHTFPTGRSSVAVRLCLCIGAFMCGVYFFIVCSRLSYFLCQDGGVGWGRCWGAGGGECSGLCFAIVAFPEYLHIYLVVLSTIV